MLMHSVFILRYAADIVIGSVRRLSLLLDRNSSVSIICLLHLFAAAVCKKEFYDVQFCLQKRINIKHVLYSSLCCRFSIDCMVAPQVKKKGTFFPVYAEFTCIIH